MKRKRIYCVLAYDKEQRTWNVVAAFRSVADASAWISKAITLGVQVGDVQRVELN